MIRRRAFRFGLVVAAVLMHTACAPDEPSQDAAVATPVTAIVVKPAPKPTGPLPEGTSCVSPECHAGFVTASFIHRPVADGECSACHGPDAGDHSFPMVRGPVQTCTFCHAVSGVAAHQHAALENGCTTCHRPHTSRAKFLLTADNIEHLCQGCHDKQLKRFAHDQFRKGHCTLCHQPHESANAMLLRGGEGPQHCAICHGTVFDAMRQATLVHEPARENCVSCHNPHTTDHPNLLVTSIEQSCLSCHETVGEQIAAAAVPHGAVHTGQQCASCHNPHASMQVSLLRDRMDQTCLTCHSMPLQTADGRSIANMKPVLEQAYLHGPIRQGDCSACHASHGGERPALLTAAYPAMFYAGFEIGEYQLCFTCHDQNLVMSGDATQLTNFRDGDINLHYLHVNREEKGRTCRTCHDVHGSDLPNHMAETVPFEGSRWEMPIRFEQTTDGGSCAPGCHVPKRYSRERKAATVASESGGVP